MSLRSKNTHMKRAHTQVHDQYTHYQHVTTHQTSHARKQVKPFLDHINQN